MIEIDGSMGEGGGQILRTALSLSALLRKPFHLFNIRKGRSRPGLMPQHLMAVHAAKAISNAAVTGGEKGSTDLSFIPGEIKPGSYSFDIGTAGSTTLVLQTVMLPLCFASAGSRISITGGTHVPFSPTFEYIDRVLVPMLNSLGMHIRMEIERYGFYPQGGGKIVADIRPGGGIRPLDLEKKGGTGSITGISAVSNLPHAIAERQAAAANDMLSGSGLHADIKTVSVPSIGHGTFIFLKAESERCIAGFSSIGERGKRAERVGAEAAVDLLRYSSSPACLDTHLADQVVIYLALSSGQSAFTTASVSNHLLTNLRVIELFSRIETRVDGVPGSTGKVTINPADCL